MVRAEGGKRYRVLHQETAECTSASQAHGPWAAAGKREERNERVIKLRGRQARAMKKSRCWGDGSRERSFKARANSCNRGATRFMTQSQILAPKRGSSPSSADFRERKTAHKTEGQSIAKRSINPTAGNINIKRLEGRY